MPATSLLVPNRAARLGHGDFHHAGAGSGLAALWNHNDTDYSQYRSTLAIVEDLELVHAVYEKLGNRDDFGWREVLALMEREPELAELNAHVVQKPLHQL
jgi:hypothetical protein